MGAAIKADHPSQGGVIGCTGKKAYDSLGAASIEAKRKGDRVKGQKGNAPYRCQACGKFHLGRKR